MQVGEWFVLEGALVVTPALFTRTCTPPWVSVTASVARASAVSSRTSTWWTYVLVPCLPDQLGGLGCAGVVDVEDRADAASSAGEGLAGRSTDPAAAAGHHRHPVMELLHGVTDPIG